jgi:hypothetical protein
VVRLVVIPAFVLCTTAIVQTGSRSGLLALMAGLLVFAFGRMRPVVRVKRAEIRDHFNERRIDCGDYSLIVRAYDDGVAYRLATRLAGEIEEGVASQAELAPELAEVFVDQPQGEFILSCRYRSVSREEGGRLILSRASCGKRPAKEPPDRLWTDHPTF